MESPRLRKYSHIGLWIGMTALVGFLTWSAVNKKTSEDTSYERGSSHTEETNNYYGLLALGMKGCAYSTMASRGKPETATASAEINVKANPIRDVIKH